MRWNEPMSRHTSFRIGGPAEALLTVTAVDGLCQAVLWARQRGVPYIVIGGGTNLLVADRGLPGLVIINRCTASTVVQTPAGAVVTAEAGLRLSTLAHQMAEAGWSGLEWAASIPGTLGGAIVGNAGAFGRNIGDSLLTVCILGADGRRHELPAGDLRLGYRTSRLKSDERPLNRPTVVLSAQFALERGDRLAIAQTIQEVALIRHQAQPYDRPSAGSVFKNPPDDYAGRLIEAAGFKGARVGDAQVSPKHANFIVNLGAATASDVLALIALIRARVRENSQQDLALEIECVGLEGRPPDCSGLDESGTTDGALVQSKTCGKL